MLPKEIYQSLLSVVSGAVHFKQGCLHARDEGTESGCIVANEDTARDGPAFLQTHS